MVMPGAGAGANAADVSPTHAIAVSSSSTGAEHNSSVSAVKCNPPRVRRVYGLLPPRSAYIGTFSHAPSAGNRARQTYFERDIRSMEQVHKQHAILTNPNIGVFHIGEYVFGERFAELQRNLRQFNVHRQHSRRHNSYYEESDTQRLLRANSFTSDQAAKDGTASGGADAGTAAAEAAVCEVAQLRRSARTVTVFGSGDNLVKLAEKERRRGLTRRFKYNGAIDLSRRYPDTGSIDDCALMRPLGAGRSKLYNDLMAEVNGFRRHFVEERKASTLNPKEAYRRAKMREMEGPSGSFDGYPVPTGATRWVPDAPPPWPVMRRKRRSSSEASASMPAPPTPATTAGALSCGVVEDGHGPRHLSRTSTAATTRTPSFFGGSGGGAAAGGGDGGTPSAMGQYNSTQRHGSMGQNSFSTAQVSHTSQLALGGSWYKDASGGIMRGDAWIPGTLSAQIKKESWRNKQTMRDTTKFQPFFVQAKSQIQEIYDLQPDKMLGQGSYAKVVLARHKLTGQVVAVKAVQKRLLFSDSEKACVLHEVENQLRIVHRHVVRLYEVYETPNHLYLVLENCPCGDLEKMMYVRGFLKEIETKRVAKQLLQAVAYLHAKGIVHCDIKPQNLLFSHDESPGAPSSAASSPPSDRDRATSALYGDCTSVDGAGNDSAASPPQETSASPAGLLAKLCDFGLSRKVPDIKFFKLTGDVNKIPFNTLCGTGGFIAPEIMRQQPFGKPADMWSAGVMLYNMLCGRMPFTPARSCLDRPPSFLGATWRHVSQEAKDLINGLLEKDPTKRLTALEALEHPWLESVSHLEESFPHFVPTKSPTTPSANGTCRARSATIATAPMTMAPP